MISAIYILHRPDSSLPFSQNDLLIHRRYHNDLPSYDSILENYCISYDRQLPHEKSPFLLVKGVNYIHVKGEYDIILMAVSRQNANAMSTVIFLHNVYKLLRHYLTTTTNTSTGASSGTKGKPSPTSTTFSTSGVNTDLSIGNTEKVTTSLDRDVISDNSNLIHELLDECMDFGVVQTTDFNILKEYIKVEVNRSKFTNDDEKYYSTSSSEDEDEEGTSSLMYSLITSKKKKKKDKKKSKKELQNIKSTHNQAVKMQEIEQETFINSSILRTSSSAINWRPKGIFYAKNEIYIDLIENCDFYFDLGTQVIKRNEIFGRCEVKCYLSGMPACKVEFNEKHISGIDNDSIEEESPKEKEGNQIVVSDDEDDDVAEASPGVENHEDADTNRSSSKDTSPSTDATTETLASTSASSTTHTGKGKHIPIRNIQFHQCTQLGSLYKDNIIKFTPPDDKFTLLTYHVEQQKQIRKLPLVKITPVYKLNSSNKTLQIMCTISTQFKKRLHTQNLLVKIPVDPSLFPLPAGDENNLKFKAQLGEVSFKVDTSELYWQIGDMRGGTQDIKMMAELSLLRCPSRIDIEHTIQRRVFDNHKVSDVTSKDEENIHDSGDERLTEDKYDEISELDKYYGVNKNGGADESIQSKFASTQIKNNYFANDIHITFVIPMLSYSGLKLTYLRVDEEQMKYSSFPWVRYKTEAGTTQKNSSYRFKLGMNCFIFS